MNELEFQKASGCASQSDEWQYLQLLQKIMEQGDLRLDRTGIGTKAVFGATMRFDLGKGFPLLTTKKVFWKTAFKEILWMLSGSTSLRELLIQNVKIWTDWPLQKYRAQTGDQDISQSEFERRIVEDAEFDARWGDLGPIYGKQWRRWKTSEGKEIDQVSLVLEQIKSNPSSRRLLWDGWNVGELDAMALPPCHKHYQFFVRDGFLDAAVVVRSNDAFLGLPFNLANLGLVTHMMAEQTGLQPGEIVWMGLDVHIYVNHFEAVRQQLGREPRPFPKLKILRRPQSLFDYGIADFAIEGYEPHGVIAAEVAV